MLESLGYVLDAFLVYVFDPGPAGVLGVGIISYVLDVFLCFGWYSYVLDVFFLCWSWWLNMNHQIKNTGKKSAKKIKQILKKNN